MGEAKRRGSYDERKKLGEARQAREAAALAEWEARPENAKRRERTAKAMTVVGAFMGALPMLGRRG